MKDWKSEAHVKWDCKYHVVIVPKYRQQSSNRPETAGYGAGAISGCSSTGGGIFPRLILRIR